MSFLDSLASGLRYSGGVLNPDVQRQQATELLQQKAQEATQRNIMAQQLMTALETGAIPPDKIPQAQATLKQIGFGDSVVGPNAVTQEHQAKVTNEANYRQAIAGLGANPDMESMAKVAVAHGKPELATAFYKAQEDRAARADAVETTIQAKIDAQQRDIDAKKEAAKAAGATAQQLKAMDIAGREHIARVIATLRPPRAPEPLVQVDDGKGGAVWQPRSAAVGKSVPGKGGAMDAQQAGAVNNEAYAQIINGKATPGVSSLGTTGEPFRAAVRNRKESIREEFGWTPAELAIKGRENAAKFMALGAVEKDIAAITPYKEMLDTNAKIAIDLGQKIVKTNAQLANKPLIWLQQNAGDNPDVSEYMAQIHFVSTEAARVLNNPRLVGQMPESAVKDMQSVLNGSMPLNASKRVLERIVSDGNNRVDAMHKQRERTVDEIKGTVKTAPATTPAGETPQRRSSDRPPLSSFQN